MGGGGAAGGGRRGQPLPLLEESRGENQNDLVDLHLDSHFTPAPSEEKNSKKEKWPSGLNTKKNGGGGGMKHSLSSFFPFTSCATTASSPPPPPAASSTSFTSLALKQSPQTGSSTFSPMTGGNDTAVMEGAASWDHVKKEMGSGVYSCENDAEEDISDLGKFPFLFWREASSSKKAEII